MGEKEGDPAKGSSRSAPDIPRQAVKAVGRKLKESYQRMLDQPVPDHLLDLLDKLDRQDEAGRGEGNDEDHNASCARVRRSGHSDTNSAGGRE